MISLVLIYLLTNIPVCAYELVITYVTVDPDLNLVLYRFVELIYSLNFGSVFFVNIAFNSSFRDELYLCVERRVFKPNKSENNQTEHGRF